MTRHQAMKIYLAARYSRLEELNEYRAELQDRGHVVTSRWLDGLEQYGLEGTEEAMHSPAQRAMFAIDDTRDLLEADTVIAFTEEPGTPGGRRGGRHVELGIALGAGTRVIIVGPAENVFCELPGIWRVDTFAEITEEILYNTPFMGIMRRVASRGPEDGG